MSCQWTIRTSEQFKQIHADEILANTELQPTCSRTYMYRPALYLTLFTCVYLHSCIQKYMLQVSLYMYAYVHVYYTYTHSGVARKWGEGDTTWIVFLPPLPGIFLVSRLF